MVTHFQKIKKSPFGGTVNGTLCNRFRCTDDGMNLTDKREEVTCKLCLRKLH